jgi:ribosomal protein L40E
MEFLLAAIVLLYIEVFSIVLFLDRKKDKKVWWFIPVIIPPIQIGIGFLALYFLSILMSNIWSSPANIVTAVLALFAAGIVAFISGLILVPLVYYKVAKKKQYPAAYCPKCDMRLKWGSTHCKRCSYKFSVQEIESFKEQLGCH